MKREAFPRSPTPYFIFAPSYTNVSSGIRVMHYLCHHLNAIGQRAFLILQDANDVTNPDLLTPKATKHILAEYAFRGVEPIFVYPEGVKGNPINAQKVVRYVLAPAGFHGGDKEFSSTEQIWLYKEVLAESLPNMDISGILSIPICDTNIFYPPPANSPRRGSCFYANRYDKKYGHSLLPITKNSLRLEGPLEQLAAILRRSEVCYLYELTAVITEAPLCGCPVILVRNPFFDKYLVDQYTVGDIRWDDGEIVSQHTPEETQRIYQALIESFWKELDNFVEKTQSGWPT